MATVQDTEMFGGSDSDDADLAPSALVSRKPVDSDHEMDDDLFGDDPAPRKEVASRDTSPTPSALGDEDGLTAAERRARQALEYEEEEGDAEPAILREAEVPVPNIPLPHSSDGNHWVVRMPNFVKIDSQPFHSDTYRGPEADLDLAEQAESLRERSMSIKLEVDNTMRWRWATGSDGTKYRQSNSRIIRWSDGSMSLQLGKELFDVTSTVDTSGSVPRAGGPTVPATPAKSLSQSQSQSQSQTTPLGQSTNSQEIPDTPNRPGAGPIPHKGLSYLVAQHQTSAILQVEAPVTGFLAIRPTGMHSETHRKLVRAVGQKHSKVARLRLTSEAVAAQDPMMLNANAAKAAKKSARAAGASSRSGGGGARRGGGSDDDDSDGFGGGRDRRRTGRSSYSSRNRTSTKHDYSDDDDDDDEGGAARWGDDEDDDRLGSSPRKRRPGQSTPKSKGAAAAGTGGDYQADDFLVDDSPSEGDDDDEDGGRPRKRSSRVEEEGDEPDLLDKLDRDIEEQARKRRKESSGGPSRPVVDDDDDDVDVESEAMDMSDTDRKAAKVAATSSTLQAGDDDDDDGIPQTSRKPGKKRIIIDDDEDE